jgi:hypothetical protein
MSEENLRRERLRESERKEATALLAAMRDAHRKGEAAAVIEKANRLLALDKESLEARWYRRNAEARLRAVSVGVGTKERAAAGRPGSMSARSRRHASLRAARASGSSWGPACCSSAWWASGSGPSGARNPRSRRVHPRFPECAPLPSKASTRTAPSSSR